jgi:hypothetical protein
MSHGASVGVTRADAAISMRRFCFPHFSTSPSKAMGYLLKKKEAETAALGLGPLASDKVTAYLL